MGLKDWLKKEESAALEEMAVQERLRSKEWHEAELESASAVPHPLAGRSREFTVDYFLALLVLRGELGTEYAEEARAQDALRLFGRSLGLTKDKQDELEKSVSYYDDLAKELCISALKERLNPLEAMYFLCDCVFLHGEKFQLKGDFLESWRQVAVGVFRVEQTVQESLEKLCCAVAGNAKFPNGSGALPGIPSKLVDFCRERCGSDKDKGNRVTVDSDYLVIDLSRGPYATGYPVRTSNNPPNPLNDVCRTTELWLKRIPRGTFLMGSPADEPERSSGEELHRVTLTQDYYMGVFPVTRSQWKLVMGSQTWNFLEVFDNGCFPVERVSYDDICGENRPWPADASVSENSFFGRLRAKTRLTFDLPTEAQWEYACRAGTSTVFSFGNSCNKRLCNCAGNYPNGATKKVHGREAASPVGQYMPNAWGLYDMHGNVWEWCLDWYGPYSGDAIDPTGAQSGTGRVIRGGRWGSYPRYCRSASRVGRAPSLDYYLGFRIVWIP